MAANKIEEELDKHLNSPLSLLGKFKQFILGEEKPDSFTLWASIVNSIITFIFLLWSLLSLFVIHSRTLMESEKQINVSEIIGKRGHELGFDKSSDFIHELSLFHMLALVCWTVILIGVILQYRRNLIFVYFIGSGLIIYLITMWVNLGFDYWIQDTTGFDKTMFFIILAGTAFHFYFLKQELNGGFKGMFNSNSDQE